MREQELYAINRALDGKDIFGLQNQEKLQLTELIIEGIKTRLILSGILEAYDRFSDKGLIYTKRLQAYKNADSYIVIDNIILALTETKHAILLFYNKHYDEYSLETVAFGEVISMILKKYSFMSNCNTLDVGEEIACSNLDEYTFDAKNNFDIKIYDKNSLKSNKKYFLYDNKIHIFDYKNKTLKTCVGDEALTQLQKEVYMYV